VKLQAHRATLQLCRRDDAAAFSGVLRFAQILASTRLVLNRRGPVQVPEIRAFPVAPMPQHRGCMQ
jgi:hypothetical protein